MKRVIVFLFLILFSCKSVTVSKGHTYLYENKYLSRELIFISDSICEFKQEYKCDDIDKKYKTFKEKYNYIIKDTTIINSKRKKIILHFLILRRTKHDNSNLQEMKYVEIPILNTSCYFLDKDSRTKKTNLLGYDKELKQKKYLTVYESLNRIFDMDVFYFGRFSKNKLKFHNETYILKKTDSPAHARILSRGR